MTAEKRYVLLRGCMREDPMHPGRLMHVVKRVEVSREEWTAAQWPERSGWRLLGCVLLTLLLMPYDILSDLRRKFGLVERE
jgi:hypothetical protein